MPGPIVERFAGSLLDEIAERALDDDYYLVRPGRYSRSRQFTTVATAMMIGLFALMVTVAAVQTRLDRPATSLERQALEADVRAGNAQLADRRDTAAELRAEVALLESALDDGSPEHLLSHIIAGDQPVSGPGTVVRLDPLNTAVDDTALQGIVNALWAAGAEAVTINGHRIAGLSSIGQANGVLTVNFQSIGPPYVFAGIGDAEVMGELVAKSSVGEYWDAQADDGAAEFTIREDTDLEFPAVPDHRTTIRHAHVVKGTR